MTQKVGSKQAGTILDSWKGVWIVVRYVMFIWMIGAVGGAIIVVGWGLLFSAMK